MKEAMLYEKQDQDKVRCGLCAHRCLIKPGGAGICGVRENREGVLYSLVYGRTISSNVDPIEKKPLFHFQPGSRSMSIATVGCNFKCRHCQNSDISQMPVDHGQIMGSNMPPEEVIRKAQIAGASSISYTYTEPTIYFEYAYETARLATEAGLKNVFVSNGYMTEAALETMGRHLSAANVDLKAFSDDFYKSVCGARLEPVKETIRRMKEAGVWVEVTTLLIPGYNDDPDELQALAQWLAGVGPDIPWHISRFHPTYRLRDAPSTPAATIHQAREIGLAAGLHYVYSGNIWGDAGEKTHCHHCGHLLIDRLGFRVVRNAVKAGACPKCSTPTAGLWN